MSEAEEKPRNSHLNRFSATNQPENRGKNKGDLNRKTVIMAYLNSLERVGNTNIPRMLRLVDAQYKKAKKGDTPAFKALMDYGFGVLKQESETKHTHTVHINNPAPRGEDATQLDVLAIDGVPTLPEGEVLSDDDAKSLEAVQRFVEQDNLGRNTKKAGNQGGNKKADPKKYGRNKDAASIGTKEDQ